MLVGLNPISTLGLNLRNGLSEQNSEVTTRKEIIFYVDPPEEEFTKNYSSPSYQAAKISSHSGSTRRHFFWVDFGSTRGRPRLNAMLSKFFFITFPPIYASMFKTRGSPLGGWKELQICLFSATIPMWVRDGARTHMKPSLRIVDLCQNLKNKTAHTVQHLAISCPFQNSFLKYVFLPFTGPL